MKKMNSLHSMPNEIEIKQAVFSMSSESSAGPDGFNGKFFKHVGTSSRMILLNLLQNTSQERN